MSKFRVKPGDKITVAIEGDPPVVSPKQPEGTKYIGVDPPEDQLYVFKKNVGCKFYDLGMVQIDGEWSEVNDSVVLEYTTFGEFDPDIQPAYEALLLSKYLDRLFGDDARPRKPIAQDSTKLMIDVVRGTDDEEQTTTILGSDRPEVGDLIAVLNGGTEPPDGSNEGWKGGVLKIPSNIQSVSLRTLGYFLGFDTTGGEFKFTETPNYEAPAVEITELNTLEAIYLAPNPLLWKFQYVAVFGGLTFLLAAEGLKRLSPDANYSLIPPATITGAMRTAFINQSVSLGLYSYVLTLDSFFNELATERRTAELFVVDNFSAHPPMRFRGVLKTKSKTFYAWRVDAPASGFTDLEMVALNEIHHGMIPSN